MDLMNRICKTYLGKFAIVFIDDIFIYSSRNKEYECDDFGFTEGSENFMVYCDALHKGLGVVLMQKEKVIAYASRQLKVHERNCHTPQNQVASE
ncbi:putative reverse transcriptase domain-containing protein [Tanacetum coccineum]